MARDSDAIELDIDGHPVRITSPEKVLFSERNETKLDLVNYYLAVAEQVMRTMGGRGWLGVRLDRGPDWNEVAEIVEDAYRTVASPKYLKLLDAR